MTICTLTKNSLSSACFIKKMNSSVQYVLASHYAMCLKGKISQQAEATVIITRDLQLLYKDGKLYSCLRKQRVYHFLTLSDV